MVSLSAPVEALIATLFAPVCISCRTVLDTPLRSPVCAGCWRNLRRIVPPVCDVCGEGLAAVGRGHVCLGGSAIAALRVLGPYEGVLRDLVHAIKFDRRRSLASPLARMLTPLADPLLHDADAIVPVPLHPWRYWSRGFNQAEDLARALAGRRLPVIAALRRRRATRPQSSLDGQARRDNVRDAFAVSGLTRARRRWWTRRIEGKAVVLVDDVTTTGATLEHAAATLVAGGAREVRAVTLARVEVRAR